MKRIERIGKQRGLGAILNGFVLAVAMIALASSGCLQPRALKGGKATLTNNSRGNIEQTLLQGDNPAQQSRQHQESVRVRSYTVPAGARMEEAHVQAVSGGIAVTNVQATILNAPMPVTEREETRTEAELGAAQKDTARDLGAKLSSLRGITWLGVAMFLFGLASLVWPPLKLVIGSITTSAAILAGGLTLMILPTLIAGNELIVLGGVGLGAGAWFLAHRHGQLRGQVSTLAGTTGSPASEPGQNTKV